MPSPSPPNSTCRVGRDARGRLGSERPSRRQQTRAPSKRPVSRSSRLLRKLPRPLRASISQALAISGHQLVLQRLCRGRLCSTSESAVSCAFLALAVEPGRRNQRPTMPKQHQRARTRRLPLAVKVSDSAVICTQRERHGIRSRAPSVMCSVASATKGAQRCPLDQPQDSSAVFCKNWVTGIDSADFVEVGLRTLGHPRQTVPQLRQPCRPTSQR